jgi:hypothetical protein
MFTHERVASEEQRAFSPPWVQGFELQLQTMNPQQSVERVTPHDCGSP